MKTLTHGEQKMKDMIDEIVCMHGEILRYTADCYSKKILNKLKKTGVTTYQVRIGNTTAHYFSNQLPKLSDFNPDYNPAIKKISPYFFRQLKKEISKSKFFIKGTRRSNQINKLTVETL